LYRDMYNEVNCFLQFIHISQLVAED